MTETRHICDRCGSAILTDRSLCSVESGPLRKRCREFELCADCAELLVGWLAKLGRQREASGAPLGAFPPH